MATRTGDLQVAAERAALILSAVRWYLRYSLSYRDVEELLEERGLEAHHTTLWRWVQRYGRSWDSGCSPGLRCVLLSPARASITLPLQ